jgi:transcriptional regulator with XRE-family HTH domain
LRFIRKIFFKWFFVLFFSNGSLRGGWMELGEQIATLREEQALTQVELAEAARISPSTLSQIESGKVPSPHVGTVRKLARALGVEPAELRRTKELTLSGKAKAPESGPTEERRSPYLEAFKKYMARRASAWDQQADEESSRFFADWRTSAAYAGEVIGEAFVLTRTAVKELWPAIDQDFALEDAVREQRELVDAVKNMLKVVDKVRARGAPALERAIQGGIDHAELEEARAEKEQLAKERRAAFKLLHGRQSA